MIESIRAVFTMPTDESVGGVIENEGRMGCPDLARIDDRLESLPDALQNRAPRDLLIVFQAIPSVLFHGRHPLKLAVTETMDAAYHH